MTFNSFQFAAFFLIVWPLLALGTTHRFLNRIWPGGLSYQAAVCARNGVLIHRRLCLLWSLGSAVPAVAVWVDCGGLLLCTLDGAHPRSRAQKTHPADQFGRQSRNFGDFQVRQFLRDAEQITKLGPVPLSVALTSGLLLMQLMSFLKKDIWMYWKLPSGVRAVGYAVGAILIAVAGHDGAEAFIYFQF